MYGISRSDFTPPVLDRVALDSAPFLRSNVRLDLAMLVFQSAQFELLTFALDFSKFESLLPFQSAAHSESASLPFGMARLRSSPFAVDCAHLEPTSFLRGFARSDSLPSVTDLTKIELLLLLQAVTYPGFTISVFGESNLDFPLPVLDTSYFDLPLLLHSFQ